MDTPNSSRKKPFKFHPEFIGIPLELVPMKDQDKVHDYDSTFAIRAKLNSNRVFAFCVNTGDKEQDYLMAKMFQYSPKMFELLSAIPDILTVNASSSVKVTAIKKIKALLDEIKKPKVEEISKPESEVLLAARFAQIPMVERKYQSGLRVGYARCAIDAQTLKQYANEVRTIELSRTNIRLQRWKQANNILKTYGLWAEVGKHGILISFPNEKVLI